MMDLLEKLAIITVTRDRPHVLRDSLTRTRRVFPADVPIIVHDDASQHLEEVHDALKGLGNIVLLRSDYAIGPGGGRNRCVAEAETPFCLSLDDDCYVNSKDELYKWLLDRSEHSDIAVIGCQYHRTYDGSRAPSSHIASGPSVSFHGGASLLRREAFLRIEGYRELLGFGCEDTELARRVWGNGYRVWYDASYVVEHKHVAINRNRYRLASSYVKNTLLLESLSGDPLWGLPLGIYRAIRRGLAIGYLFPLLEGLGAGVRDTLLHWKERSPLPSKTVNMLREMDKS